MMIIVRVFPRGGLSDSWQRAVNNVEKISNKHCTPLYVSQQEEKAFMSIIYDVRDIDAFADVLLREIPSIANSEKTRTITLLKPVFFPAPRDRPRQLERYQVALRVTSNEVENVFNNLVRLDYPKDSFPTYAAYSFGEDDILLSMLSVSRDKIETFARENVESQKGVLGVDVARIDMSKRLAPAEMWKEFRESRYPSKSPEGYEAYDFIEPFVRYRELVRQFQRDSATREDRS
jgi:hypothetical protein